MESIFIKIFKTEYVQKTKMPSFTSRLNLKHSQNVGQRHTNIFMDFHRTLILLFTVFTSHANKRLYNALHKRSRK